MKLSDLTNEELYEFAKVDFFYSFIKEENITSIFNLRVTQNDNPTSTNTIEFFIPHDEVAEKIKLYKRKYIAIKFRKHLNQEEQEQYKFLIFMIQHPTIFLKWLNNRVKRYKHYIKEDKNFLIEDVIIGYNSFFPEEKASPIIPPLGFVFSETPEQERYWIDVYNCKEPTDEQ